MEQNNNEENAVKPEQTSVSSSPVNENAEQVFYGRRNVIGQLTIVGIILFFGLIFVSGTPGMPSYPFAPLIILLVVLTMRYNIKLVVIGSDFISLKKAPARAAVSILIAEINQVEIFEKKIHFTYQTANSGTNYLEVLNLQVVEDEERMRLIEALNTTFNGKIIDTTKKSSEV